MEPGEIPTGQVGAATHPPKPALVPLAKRACIKEIDQILLSVLNAGRKEVHAAIEKILKGWPGVTRDELWDRLRYLRDRCSQVHKGQTEWGEEDLATSACITRRAEREQGKPSRSFVRVAQN